MDIKRFAATFSTEERYVDYLARARWPHGPVCDKCGSVSDAWKTARERVWICRSCKREFSVTAGTPLENTHLPLTTWFIAVRLIALSSDGISVMEVSRQLGITYKTAWFLCRTIRQSLANDDPTLRSIVHVDQALLPNKRRRRTAVTA